MNYENIKRRSKSKSKLDYYGNLLRFKENNYIDYSITYSNPQYGNGHTYNSKPLSERPELEYNHALYSEFAYKDNKVDNKKPKNDKEEDIALKEDVDQNKSDNGLVKMKVPEWFCSVICSGLEVHEILPKKPLNNKLTIRKSLKKKNNNYRFKEINLDIKDFEENDAVNPMDDNEFDEE